MNYTDLHRFFRFAKWLPADFAEAADFFDFAFGNFYLPGRREDGKKEKGNWRFPSSRQKKSAPSTKSAGNPSAKPKQKSCPQICLISPSAIFICREDGKAVKKEKGNWRFPSSRLPGKKIRAIHEICGDLSAKPKQKICENPCNPWQKKSPDLSGEIFKSG